MKESGDKTLTKFWKEKKMDFGKKLGNFLRLANMPPVLLEIEGRLFVFEDEEYAIVGKVTGLGVNVSENGKCLLLFVSVPEFAGFPLERLVFTKERKWEALTRVRPGHWKRRPGELQLLDERE